LLTYDKFNKIGEYVNAQNGNGDDAYSIDNYQLFLRWNNKLCIVTSAKGEQPK
jgi:hypothetical protein